MGYAHDSVVENPPMQETLVRSLGREDPLEEVMANNPSIVSWEHWQRIKEGYSPRNGKGIGHDLAIKQQQQIYKYYICSAL